LLLVDDYYPSTKAAARLIDDLGRDLVGHGHRVIVLTPSSDSTAALGIFNDRGLQVVRVGIGKLKDVSRAIRGWRESRMSATLWRRAKHFFRANPCDLIIYYSPSIFFGALVKRLKTLWRCPAYLVLRDIFPKWAVDAGVLRKGMLYRYFRSKELLQYSVADVIGVEAPGNLQYFCDELGDKSYRLEVLLNWADPGAQLRPNGARRQALGLTGKVVFFYGGNIGVAQDIDNILRLAASLAAYENIFFLLVGSGSEVPRIRALVDKQGLRNIRVLDAVSQEEYLALLSEFDVGLVSLDRRLRTSNLTGKMLGYMTCGLPILASLNPGNDLAALLKQSDAGIACDNGDDESLRAAAILLAGNPGLRERLGGNSRRLLESKFSVRAAAAQILRHFPALDAAASSRWESTPVVTEKPIEVSN
jgi:glycosyltransferase involved in cell wall biosynthesis